jgi:aspartate aminotransferase-like enzyme
VFLDAFRRTEANVGRVFGTGMGYWLQAFGAQLHELELLSVVHCETPSGTVNDCAAIGPIARARGVLTLVDCVASLGGMALDRMPGSSTCAWPGRRSAWPARSRYGVMLADGQGAGNLVRIGHMGPAASGLYPVVALMALGRALADLGVPVRTGNGAEAALAVLSEAAAP